MLEGNVIISLYEKLSMIDDPRDSRGKKYDLSYILILIIIGFLMGKNDFVNIEHVLKMKQSELKAMIPGFKGIPSHDTFSRVTRNIKANEINYALFDWMEAIIKNKGKHIAIDGKGVRAATEKVKGQNTPYVINAFLTEEKLVVGQYKIDEKTNEISGIPRLLKLLDIKDAIITIDAIGTQTAIVNQIIEAGGHFVLPVKGNQGATQEAIEEYMKDLILEDEKKRKNQSYERDYSEILQYLEEFEDNHGRNERRRYYVSYNTESMNDTKFKKIKGIGYIIRQRKIPKQDTNGYLLGYDESCEEIAYIMDQPLTVEEFAKTVRDHWGIESFHWVMDNAFMEDRSTAKKGNAIANISFLRKVAYNIIRLYKMRIADKPFEYVQDEFSHNMSLTKSFVLDGIESFY